MTGQNVKYFAGALAMAVWLAGGASGQTFSSGSTGSDGAYNPTVSGDFDPVALNLDPSGDNVFNFTTINIPAGVTIRLRASKVRNMPVVWLATGNVTIAGTLNLSGATPVQLNSSDPVQTVQNRAPSEPGPGGYPGGLGALGSFAPEAGAGPGGGVAGQVASCSGLGSGGAGASFNTGPTSPNVTTAPTYGSQYLVPLYGGSGGGGGWGVSAGQVGGIGGAGGGAIRIVSTTQITVSGSINASGGDPGTVTGGNTGCSGGPGAGGAIHLIAPVLTGTANLIAAYSGGTNGVVDNGIVRFDTASNTMTGTPQANFTVGPLYNVPPNSTLSQGSLWITQVNGVNVPAVPLGQYLTPDVQINANTPVTVNIAAANIPLGTQPVLRVTAETVADQSITCTPLAGASAASSTATCTATFAFSVSIASLRTTW